METRRCAAFGAAMDILGRPWNGVLLRALHAGPTRFSVLAEQLSIGDRMLSCRLKDLEAAGLVERTVEPGPPIRVSYALTPLGHGLDGVTQAIEAWGQELLEARAAGEGSTCSAQVCDEAMETCEDEPVA